MSSDDGSFLLTQVDLTAENIVSKYDKDGMSVIMTQYDPRAPSLHWMIYYDPEYDRKLIVAHEIYCEKGIYLYKELSKGRMHAMAPDGFMLSCTDRPDDHQGGAWYDYYVGRYLANEDKLNYLETLFPGKPVFVNGAPIGSKVVSVSFSAGKESVQYQLPSGQLRRAKLEELIVPWLKVV